MVVGASLLLLLAIIASIVAAQSQQPPPRAEKSRQQEQGQPQAPQESATTNQKTAPLPPIVVNVVPTPKTEPEAAEERRDRQEKAELDRRSVDLTAELARFTAGLYYATVVLAIATVFLVIATSGLGYFSWRQSVDMKASIIVAQRASDAAVLSAKAAVGIELPIIRADQPELLSITGGIPEQGPYAGSDLAGYPYENCAVSRIFLRNHGRTRAFPTQLALGHKVVYVLPENPNYTRIIHFAPGAIIHQNKPFEMAINFEIVLSDSDRLHIRGAKAESW